MAHRRAEIAMSAEEIEKFLAGKHMLICATNGPRGWPHVVPIWYLPRAEGLVAWSYRKSQKVRNLERDPRATVQVESGSSPDEVRAVMIEAETTFITDPGEIGEIGLALWGRYAGEDGGIVPEEVRTVLLGQVPKRVGMLFAPVRTVSWDHSRLSGFL